MRTRVRKSISLFLAALLLCLTAFPSAAEESVESATAATMQLMKTEGTVGVSNSSGRGLTMRDNMRLYNGYHVETEAASYAWINLDSSKLTKLSEVSEAEVRKSGKELELLLNSGCLFFNVTHPLEDGETLNIRTSTMAVGVRGTCGWITVDDRWSTEIYVLEGTVQCNVTDPVTAQVKSAEIHGGEMAIAVAYPQDRQGDKCDILMDRFETGDIDGFVLTELAQDPDLCDKIYEDSGLDVRSVLGTARERLERDQREMRDKLDRIEEQLAQQDNNVSTNGVWERGASNSKTSSRSSSRRSSSGGGGGSNSGSGGESSDGNDDVTDNPPVDDPTVPAQSTVTLLVPGIEAGDSETRPAFAQEVQGHLNDANVSEVVLEMYPANEQEASKSGYDTFVVYENLVVPAGKKLTVSEEIKVLIMDYFSLTVNGTMTCEDLLTNQGSLTVNGTLTGGDITNYGSITVSSSDTLRASLINNYGTITNTANGKIAAERVNNEDYGSLSNAGRIEGYISVNSGAFTMTGGTVDGGEESAVYVTAGASFTLSGGEVISSVSSLSNATVFCNGGTLELTGGMITNRGTNYALNFGDVDPVVTLNGTIFRSKSDRIIYDTGITWDHSNYDITGPDSEGYYRFEPSGGDIGNDLTWSLEGDVLTINGTGPMEDYPTGGNVPWKDSRDTIKTVIIQDGVTSIGAWAFFECEELTDVTIPSSITSIKNWAFQYCYKLSEVNIPNNVTDIGNNAFCECTSLTSIVIPDSVTSIGENAFYKCDGLTSLTIGSGVTTIGAEAFNLCNSLSNVTYNSTEQQWTSINKGNNILPSGTPVQCTTGGFIYTG